jgi:hypothetical protein
VLRPASELKTILKIKAILPSKKSIKKTTRLCGVQRFSVTVFKPWSLTLNTDNFTNYKKYGSDKIFVGSLQPIILLVLLFLLGGLQLVGLPGLPARK